MLLSGLFLLLSRFLSHRPELSGPPEIPLQNPLFRNKITETMIRVEMMQSGFGLSMQSIAVAVAKHETGNFTSSIYRKNHNLFGMKMPVIRETTATGKLGNYAKFENDVDSVKDYILYLDYCNYPRESSVEAYSTLAKEKGYYSAPEKTYLEGLISWM